MNDKDKTFAAIQIGPIILHYGKQNAISKK